MKAPFSDTTTPPPVEPLEMELATNLARRLALTPPRVPGRHGALLLSALHKLLDRIEMLEDDEGVPEKPAA